MTKSTSATPSRKTAASAPPAKVKPVKPSTPVAKKAPKPAPAVKSRPVAQPIAAKVEQAKVKHKLVRDSFTIPKQEYAVLDALKLRAAQLTRPTKKSELIRAGIAALAAMSDKAFLAAIGNVPSLKTGRPKTAE